MLKTEYKQNSHLIASYKDGNEKALQELCEMNMGLVTSIASRFQSRGYELEDLIEVGKIGLLKAIEGFDASLGYSFSTYAFPLITGEIKRFLRDDGLIKISRSVKANAKKILDARQLFLTTHGRDARIGELSEITGLSPESITQALEALNPVCSLEDRISNDNNSLRICDTIPSPDAFDGITDRIALRQSFSKLDDKEKQLIILRFFKNLTQSQVSRELGISQVTVSRMEKRIIDKLRQDFL